MEGVYSGSLEGLRGGAWEPAFNPPGASGASSG